MWYFIRLTTDNTDKQQIAQMLGEPFLISKEYSKRDKLHYHIVWETSLAKEEVKNKFYDAFPKEPKGTGTLKVDQIGNTIEDWEQVSTYTVKDKDYIHSKYFDEYIQKFVDNSFTKRPCFTVAQKALIKETLEEEVHKINWYKLVCNLAILISDYDLPLYMTKVDALVSSLRVKVDNNYVYELKSCHYLQDG